MSSPLLDLFFDKCKQLQISASQPSIIISIKTQKLWIFNNNTLQTKFSVSTSIAPSSCRENSFGTPWGLHQVYEKIGYNNPMGMIFKNRKPTGIVATPNRESENQITTRILRLKGLEEGINQGKHCDSFLRFIYIHGTNQENKIGIPQSHGCILLSNKDIIKLYKMIPNKTLVWIIPPK